MFESMRLHVNLFMTHHGRNLPRVKLKKKKKSKNFVFLDYQFYFLPKWKIELVTWRNRNRRFREQTPSIFGRWFSLLTTSVQRKPLNHFSTSITYNITANYTILARLTKITQVEQDHKKLSIRIFFFRYKSTSIWV